MSEDRRQPFLKRAQGKSADDRTFFEKLAVSIYGEDKPILPDLTLDEDLENIVEQLPLDVQSDVARYKNIFRETPEVLENYLKEYRDKGFSDYIEKGRFYDDLQLRGDDQLRLQDYNFLGKGMYDAAYRKDEAGGKARQKILESVPGQLATGVSVGLGSAIRGTSELVASLSDLYLDTEILDNVERALGDVDINKIYEGDAGTLARFTSILTQYGTGFAVAQKIVKKVAGKAIKTRLAEKSAKALLKTEGAKNLAKFGGYYMLPAGIADTAVSTTDQQSLGEIFGKDDGNLIQNILYNTSLEDIEGLTGKERAAAVLRNKLKFGAEGTAFMGTLKLIGPAVKTTAKGTGVLLNNVVGPALTGVAKVITYKDVIPEGFRIISKNLDTLTTKAGIPKKELWKFGDFQSGVKSGVFKGLDDFASKFKSGGRFDVQTRNELKKIEGLNKSAKKDFDIFAKALDGEMYKLVDAGFNDVLFNTATAQRAMTYWDDVLKYMRGELKLKQLPKSLQQYSQVIRKLVDDQQEKILPILKDMKIKDDTLKNMGRYFKTSYEIFKNSRFRAPKEDYQSAIKYFEQLIKKANPKTYKGIGSGTDFYNKKINKDAIQAVNKVLEIGRSEGTTPAQRLKAIVSVMDGEKIPKNTFAKFFSKEQLLPDEIAKLLGKVDDPKSIIMDTIAEQAYIVNNYNAYKEIADFGVGNFLFRNTDEFQNFLIKNNIAGSRVLTPIKLSKPYNIDFGNLFKNPDGTPLLTLPEMAKAMKDTTVFMDTILKLPLAKSLLGIKAAVQMNKTVLSLMTQMRNITTAAMFATANGHVGAGASVSDTFKYLFDDLIGKTKNPDELRKLLKEALDNGAIDTSTIAQELQQMIPELMGSAKLPSAAKAGRLSTIYEGKTSDQIFNYLFTNKGALGKVVQKAIESYQMGDNLWKLYGYNFTKSQLNAGIKNMGDVKKYFREIEGYDFRPLKADGTKKSLDDAIQEIAGIQVRDVYPNYSMIPTFVLNVRKFPLAGNFVAFTSEMYRNSYQIARRGLKEMQSSNPYIRQIGARRLLGFSATVGAALPVSKKIGQMATEISDEILDAYADRFAPEFEKGKTMVPVEAQDPKTKAWKSTDMSTMVPYADIFTPFKSAMQTILTGKNPDQTTLNLFGRAFVDFMNKSVGKDSPFLAPSIAAETGYELSSGLFNDGVFRTKAGGLITDWKNDDDWWSKLLYHAYKKLTPTTIRSGEEIAQAIGGDLSKAGIKRDLYDTVLKVLTGFGIRRQDPFTAYRFKLGRYAKELGRAKAAFTTDITDARRLQTDLRLIERNLSPEYFTKEFEKLQSNKYRIMSELYKDVQALRVIGFTDKEIIEMTLGRRAASKKDLEAVLLGVFNPDKPPAFRKDSGIIKAIEQINRETENNYKVTDFVDLKALADVQKKYSILPLGLSESERENLLRTTIPGKREEILKPAIEDFRQNLQDQQGAVPQTPIPNVPMPNIAPVTAAVDQNTGLTRTEQALLSPEEQLIAQRGKGILSLV